MRFWPFKHSEQQTKRPNIFQCTKSEKVSSSIELPKPNTTGGMSLADALGKRRSVRNILYESISMQQLSDLLWAACGVNLVKGTDEEREFFFTNPTASNHREVSVYIFSDKGIFLYDSIRNILLYLNKHDRRKKLSNLPFVKKAAISLCIVSDIDKMVRHKDTFRQQLYSSIDVGYVSQNIYLHCAANGLATCACGLIDRKKISKILGLTNAKVMLVHPIGIKKINKEYDK